MCPFPGVSSRLHAGEKPLLTPENTLCREKWDIWNLYTRGRYFLAPFLLFLLVFSLKHGQSETASFASFSQGRWVASSAISPSAFRQAGAPKGKGRGRGRGRGRGKKARMGTPRRFHGSSGPGPLWKTWVHLQRFCGSLFVGRRAALLTPGCSDANMKYDEDESRWVLSEYLRFNKGLSRLGQGG